MNNKIKLLITSLLAAVASFSMTSCVTTTRGDAKGGYVTTTSFAPLAGVGVYSNTNIGGGGYYGGGCSPRMIPPPYYEGYYRRSAPCPPPYYGGGYNGRTYRSSGRPMYGSHYSNPIRVGAIEFSDSNPGGVWR